MSEKIQSLLNRIELTILNRIDSNSVWIKSTTNSGTKASSYYNSNFNSKHATPNQLNSLRKWIFPWIYVCIHHKWVPHTVRENSTIWIFEIMARDGNMSKASGMSIETKCIRWHWRLPMSSMQYFNYCFNCIKVTSFGGISKRSRVLFSPRIFTFKMNIYKQTHT